MPSDTRMTEGPSPPRPIAILGFGRSGTTWVSDIVSTCLGGLILFEPMFPTALESASAYCYADVSETDSRRTLEQHFNAILAEENHAPWLLRNHVKHPLDQVDPAFLDRIWAECRIVGFKEIRANFMIDQLAGDWGYRTLFVLRHPCAVISSPKGRPWFWKGDFDSFEIHLVMFDERVLKNPKYAEPFSGIDTKRIIETGSQIEKEALIWAATHKVALAALARTGTPLLYYEDLFADPFSYSRELLEAVTGDASRLLHPAYIFTPSMVTLKTSHDLYFADNSIHEAGPSFFWKERLTEADVSSIEAVVSLFDLHLCDALGKPDPRGIDDVRVLHAKK